MNQKVRQSNIELLRILAMFFIITFHYCYYSGYVFEALNYNSYLVKIFYFGGELGVNIFMLISGYFLINSKFSVKKLIKLILEVNFYYLLALVIANHLNIIHSFSPFSLKETILLLFNVTTGKYWFATVYILIYLFSPFLNMFFKSLTKENWQKFLLLFIVVASIIPTFIGLFYNNSEVILSFNRLTWLIGVYSFGGYIRIYNLKLLQKRKNALILTLTTTFLLIFSIYAIYQFKKIFPAFSNLELAYFWHPNTILLFLLSLALFTLFLNLKIKPHKIINRLASTTLGIYLIHESVLRSYLWHTVFHSNIYLNSKFSLIYILLTAMIVFFGGALIDLIRQFLEKHTVDKVLNSSFFAKISNKGHQLLTKILNVF